MRDPASALLLAIGLSLSASAARADILPSNTHPCDSLAVGKSCLTDACNPGVCRTINLACHVPAPDCLPCLLSHSRDTDAQAKCVVECPKGYTACVVCDADDQARDLASTTYRYRDCDKKKAGDACKTEDCEDGACAIPPCDAPPCSETPTCVASDLSGPLEKDTGDLLPARVATALTAGLGLFALYHLLRRNRPDRPRKPDG